jgi:hypothetical protein
MTMNPSTATTTPPTWEVYGLYATTRQYLAGEFRTFAAATREIRRNPLDEMTIIKVLADGTRTTDF